MELMTFHFCRDGAERSGLLCVVSVVLERMKVEQDVAIGHVIEELRSCREQIIPTLVKNLSFNHLTFLFALWK